MNIALLTKIAEWLEAGGHHVDEKGLPVTFNMAKGLAFDVEDNEYTASANDYEGCGAVCCIAGAAIQFSNPRFLTPDVVARETGEAEWGRISAAAADTLGLDLSTAYRLFDPPRYNALFRGQELSDFNDPAWAARVIRHLLATGDVDWEGTQVPP